MERLPDMIKDYLKEMIQRGDGTARELFKLYASDESLTYTLTREQAEAIAERLNEYLLPIYEIPIGQGLTITRLIDFLPENDDEDMRLYGYFYIKLSKDMTKTGRGCVLDVTTDDVTIRWESIQ